jgi:hypothetical protein
LISVIPMIRFVIAELYLRRLNMEVNYVCKILNFFKGMTFAPLSYDFHSCLTVLPCI